MGFYVKVNPIKKQQLFNKAKEIYEDVLFSFSVLLNNIKGKSPQKIEKCISRSKVNIRDFLSWSKRSESDIYYFLEPETFVLRLENQITELIEIINKIVKKLNIVVFVILTDVDHIITTKNTLTIEISKQYIINIVLKQIHVNNVIFIHEYTYSLKNSLPDLYFKITNDSLNKIISYNIDYSWVLYKIFNLIFFALNNKKFIKKEMKYVIENLPQDLNNEFIDDYIEIKNIKTRDGYLKSNITIFDNNIKLNFNFPSFWDIKDSLTNFNLFLFDNLEIYIPIYEEIGAVNYSLLLEILPKNFELDNSLSNLIKIIENKKYYKTFIYFYNFYLSYIYSQSVFYKYIYKNLIKYLLGRLNNIFKNSKEYVELDEMLFADFYNEFQTFLNSYPETFLLFLFLYLDIKEPPIFCKNCLILFFLRFFMFLDSEKKIKGKNIDIIEFGFSRPRSVLFSDKVFKFNKYISLDIFIRLKNNKKEKPKNYLIPLEFYLFFQNIFMSLRLDIFDCKIYVIDFIIFKILESFYEIVFNKYKRIEIFSKFLKKIYNVIRDKSNLKKVLASICLIYVISYIDYIFDRLILSSDSSNLNLENISKNIISGILDPFSLNTLVFSDVIIWEVNELREIINKIIILFNEEKITYTELEQQLIKYLKRNKKYKKILKEDRNDKEAILSIKDHNIVYYILKLIEMVLSED